MQAMLLGAVAVLLGACHTLFGHLPAPSTDSAPPDHVQGNERAVWLDSSLDAPRACAGDWWNPSWAGRQRFAIDLGSTAAELTGLPVLVQLDLSAYDADAFQPGGDDLRFVSSSGDLLPHEVELWDASGQRAWIWVRVPSMRGDPGEHFWLYFRGPGSALAPSAVWDPSFVGVWHLQRDPAGGAAAVTDSSSAQNHGTAQGLSTSARSLGKIGPAYTFDGKGHVRIPSSATDSLGALAELTLEAWVRLDNEATTSALHTVVARQLGTSYLDAYTLLMQNSPLTARFQTSTGTANDIVTSDKVQKKVWMYLAGVRTAKELRLYVDAVEVQKGPSTVNTITTDANDVTIGCEENDASATPNECWRGMIDEVRVSNVARSAAWLAASHRSGAGTLLKPEAVERCGGGD